MDEEVHGFVSDALPPLNTRVRSSMPFIPNGSDPSAWDSSAFSQRRHHSKHHRRPDVAERGMDEEVHGFVSDALPPLNTRVRSSMPFIPNGSDPSAWDSSAFSQRKHYKRPDVAERGMDEEVHGFVTDSLPPLNVIPHSETPFIPNGSDASAHAGSAFLGRRDIAERGIDSDVWGFTTEALPPMTTTERNQIENVGRIPFIPNGSQNQWPTAFSQVPDIAERSMDETWVHPFTSGLDVVLPTANPWTRPYLPYNSNGGSNAYAQV